MAGEDDGGEPGFPGEPQDHATDAARTQLLPTVAPGHEVPAASAPSVRAVARRPATPLPALGHKAGGSGRAGDRRRRAASTDGETSGPGSSGTDPAVSPVSIGPATPDPDPEPVPEREATPEPKSNPEAKPEPEPERKPKPEPEPADPGTVGRKLVEPEFFGPQFVKLAVVEPAVVEPEVVEEPPTGRHAASSRAGTILDAAFRDSHTDEWIVPPDQASALEVRTAAWPAVPVARVGPADALPEPATDLAPHGPAVLEADSWEAVPPSMGTGPGLEADYQGRRRATPRSRVRLIAVLVLVAAALAVGIPWTLTLVGPAATVDPAPTLGGNIEAGLDSPDAPSPTVTASASALPAIGASPRQSSQAPSPSVAPSPTAVPTATLLSQGRPTATSALETGNVLVGANAVDGNPGTRWGSAFADPQWISVDLGAAYSVTRVRLTWEAAYARSYEIQTSTDNATWTTAFGTTGGDGGVDDVTVTATGRWVRILGTQRATPYGYSLWELEIYGIPA